MKKYLSLFKKPTVILSILLIIAVAFGVYFYIQYKALTRNPAAEANAETEKVINQISKLMVITDSSNAVLATITDKTKLAGQKFFDVAQNGDDLVLFPAIQKAVLFRPSIDKIIDVGPFTPNTVGSSTTPISQPSTSKPTSASSTKSK